MSELGPFAQSIFQQTYATSPSETWAGAAHRVASWLFAPGDPLRSKVEEAIRKRKLMPGGRYLYAAGSREKAQNTNCFLLRADDSAEGWGELLRLHAVGLSKGGGIGTWYNDVRPRGSEIHGYGGKASGPVALMRMINEVARHMEDGASRRSALWAGLQWDHPDIQEFITVKDWDSLTRHAKALDPKNIAPLDMTNVSVGLNDDFFQRVDAELSQDSRAYSYRSTWTLFQDLVKRAVRTGEPGFSVNIGDHADQVLRNPCTEVTSSKHGDCCNLTSVNWSRIGDLSELEYITELGIEVLLAGIRVGWLPDPLFRDARRTFPRIGLGLMGLHEWCLQQGCRYEPTQRLENWLAVWRDTSDLHAEKTRRAQNLAPLSGVRAIAPTGTIGIIAETTTGIEPIFCVAYRMRYIRGQQDKMEWVVDPTAMRLIQDGLEPESIEDAQSLARDVTRRLDMQEILQSYVDQGISSTINLPEYGEPGNTDSAGFAATLLPYLKKLRGITFYPDGARAGQPLVPVPFDEAMERQGRPELYVDNAACIGGVCGV